MKKLIDFFHECINDALNDEYCEKDIRCAFCGGEFTELAHNVSNSKANKILYGDMIDIPLLGVIFSCRECNSGFKRGYSRIVKVITPDMINIAREAFIRYSEYVIKNR